MESALGKGPVGVGDMGSGILMGWLGPTSTNCRDRWGRFYCSCHGHLGLEPVGQADPILGDHVEQEDLTHRASSPVFAWSQASRLLDPAKYLLPPSSCIERLSVAGMAGAAPVHGDPPVPLVFWAT